MPYGQKIYYKKKKLYKKKGYKRKTYIPRAIPSVLRLKHKYTNMILSGELQNFSTLNTPFSISFYPYDMRPFNNNSKLPLSMWADQCGGTSAANSMGYDTKNIYAVKLKVTVLANYQEDIALGPREWVVASTTHSLSMSTAPFSDLSTSDTRRHLAENGIFVKAIEGNMPGQQKGSYVYKKFLTLNQALKSTPGDPWTPYQSSLDINDNPIFTIGFVCRSEITGSAATLSEAQNSRFRLYIKLTQYIDWRRTDFISLVT